MVLASLRRQMSMRLITAILALLLVATAGPAAAQECAAVTISPRGVAHCVSPVGNFTSEANPSRSDGVFTDAPRYIPPAQQCPAGAMCN
jgi:hypothetical protein